MRGSLWLSCFWLGVTRRTQECVAQEPYGLVPSGELKFAIHNSQLVSGLRPRKANASCGVGGCYSGLPTWVTAKTQKEAWLAPSETDQPRFRTAGVILTRGRYFLTFAPLTATPCRDGRRIRRSSLRTNVLLWALTVVPVAHRGR